MIEMKPGFQDISNRTRSNIEYHGFLHNYVSRVSSGTYNDYGELEETPLLSETSENDGEVIFVDARSWKWALENRPMPASMLDFYRIQTSDKYKRKPSDFPDLISYVSARQENIDSLKDVFGPYLEEFLTVRYACGPEKGLTYVNMPGCQFGEEDLFYIQQKNEFIGKLIASELLSQWSWLRDNS